MKKTQHDYDSSQENPHFRVKPNPIRVNEPGHIHFVTTSCYKRKPFFSKYWTRQLVMESIDWMRCKNKFKILGYVLMPEHAHFLIVPNQNQTISNAVKDIKWYASIQLLAALRSKGMQEHVLWQARFYDFNIHSSKKLIEKLNYCHMNPVKRGLVSSPDEWPHSSFRNYENDDDSIFQVDRWWECWKI